MELEPYGRLVSAVVVGCAAAAAAGGGGGTNADGADYGSSCSGEELATNVVGGRFKRACCSCWFDSSFVCSLADGTKQAWILTLIASKGASHLPIL